MNFASHSRIYSLYPKATFKDNIGLKITQPFRELDSEMAREKYVERGFELLDNASRISEQMRSAYKFDGTTRHMGDGHCWRIDFDDGMQLGNDRHDVAGWVLENVKTRPMADFVEVTGEFIHSFPLPRGRFSEAVKVSCAAMQGEEAR